MATYGRVRVKNGKYRIAGDFHQLDPHLPIRNADQGDRLCGITNPRQMTYLHSYGAEAPFFEALGQKKLLASRCDAPGCQSRGCTYLPFRIFCPDCLGRNTVIDVTDKARQSARVYTFMVCERSGAFNLLDRPIKFINLEFEGIDTILMSYLSLGEPSIGLEVVPIFRAQDPTFTILDLSWVPKGTAAGALPQGFSF